MHAPKLDKNVNTKLDPQETAAEKSVSSPIQRDPLVQQISRMGNAPNPSAHAAVLNRAPANQQSSNRQLLLQLQQQYGNPYVNQVLQLAREMGGETSVTSTEQPLVQTKLTIGAAGDKYEQEADRTARQVVQRMNAPASQQPEASEKMQPAKPEAKEISKKPQISTIQRQEIPELEKEEDEPVQLQSETGIVQRACSKCDKEQQLGQQENKLAQMQPLVQRQSGDKEMTDTPDLETSIQKAQGKGQPLSDNVRGQMEQAFGADFSGVRIHTGSQSDQLNKSIQARAFTTGQDIFLRSGEYAPASKQGQELLAHELTHVVQQNGDRKIQRKSDTSQQKNLQTLAANTIGDRSSEINLDISNTQPELNINGVPEKTVTQTPPTKVPTAVTEANRVQPKAATATGVGTSLKGMVKRQSTPTAQAAAPISADEPGQIIEQLKNTPPTQAAIAYKQAQTDSVQALENQKQQVESTIPEIPAPTGLPASPPPEEGAEEATNEPQSESAGGQASPPPEETPLLGIFGALATGAVQDAVSPKENISEMNTDANKRSTEETPSLGGTGTFGALATGGEQDAVSPEENISEVNTDAGDRPTIKLRGETDPSQMDATLDESTDQVQETKTEAAQDIKQNFGENNIFPQASDEILKANKQFSPFKHPSEKISKAPSISPEIVGGLNQGLTPFYKEQIAPEQEKYKVGKNKFDTDSANARSHADEEINNFNEEAKNKQLAKQKQAKQEVKQLRQDWQFELDNVDKNYQEKAGNALKEQRQKIHDEKTKAEAEADRHLTEAEKKAEAEKKKAEEEARKKEEEAQEPKSFWEEVGDFFKDIGEAIVDFFKDLFNALIEAINAIFEAAKQLVKAVIDLAQKVITGLIQAFGEILKGIVKVAFAAFPEISKKFSDKIDEAVNKAVDTVNAVADWLKKAVSSILDFLAKILDKLLRLLQDLVQGIFNVIGMIITGKIGELIQRIGYLIEAAKAMPSHFETAALEELLGGGELNLDKPLSPEELAQAQQAGINIPSAKGEGIPQAGEAGEMPKAPWTEQNVGVDAVEDNMELSPELTAELMQRTNGEGEEMLAESNDPSRSMESIMSEVTGEQQVGGKQEQQHIPDDGLTPKQRASIKWELMKQGIKDWFSKNWPILLAALIAGTAIIIGAIVASGGAVLAALPVIMDILAVVFAAEIIARIGGYLRDYITKAWKGDIQGGAKSLAKALAAGAIEIALLLTFEAGKVAVKGAKAAGKAGAKVFRGVAQGAKYTIQKGKVILKGVAGTGIGKTSKSLRELGENILERTRFKKAKIERGSKNGEFEIKACINPCPPIAKGKGTKRPIDEVEPNRGFEELRSELGADEVKKLTDGLGDDVVKKLAQDLGGKEIQKLVEDLGDDVVKKLAQNLGGKNIQDLVKDLGDDVVKKLAKDLGGNEIQKLVKDLGDDVVKNLAKDLGGNEIQKLVKDLGDDVVKNLAKDLSGKNIQDLVKDLGDKEVITLAAKLSSTDIKDLLNRTTDSVELSQLLKQVGGANDAPTLLNFLKQAGSGQSAKLLDILNLVKAGDHARLNNLLALANSNAAEFQRLADITFALPKTKPTVPSVPAPSAVTKLGYGGADMQHFLDGHTFQYLNIQGRLSKPSTTLWPIGTTDTQISNYLDEALNALFKKHGYSSPAPGKPVQITLSSGVKVQVGVRGNPKTPIVGQFFPISGTGLEKIISNEMKAIWDILKP
ncbi:eCIS core domain-containing protein [Halotia branconii]|uniref:DUF4157 domain-containing protein n=1 Tax=Halotia branconii CENA392 TaxID=1539056 RepID=A0AAJ6NX36_9CYAN|nr:DUF4157 domain-containing protein [Halotia branconii]WGV28008.1 DUF4157 domain-containing protein [Halotia branconii CENA392]